MSNRRAEGKTFLGCMFVACLLIATFMAFATIAGVCASLFGSHGPEEPSA